MPTNSHSRQFAPGTIRYRGDWKVRLQSFPEVYGLIAANIEGLYFATPHGESARSDHENIDLHIYDPSGTEHCKLQVALELDSNSHAMLASPTLGESQRIWQQFFARSRKDQHIEICRLEDVEASDRDNGLHQITLKTCALPELNWDDIDISRNFLGRRFDSPILITGMTGGVSQGELINQRLASLASRFNIPMGVGSQRLALEDHSFNDIFDIKKNFPDVFLIGNIGMAQIVGTNAVELCQKAVDMISADALAIHLNVLQELIQEEGDRNFCGVLKAIEQIAGCLNTPLIIKEVGVGIDTKSAQKLINAGAAALDVGGKGGTSWNYVEGLRSASDAHLATAKLFRDWGITTGQALTNIRKENSEIEIIATGGIRSGIDVAKAIALEASMAGIGLPFMRAALSGQEHLDQSMQNFIRELKITMLTTGSRTLPDLYTVIQEQTQ
jgi:isopentenyl-diphosphate Delta-isomerase